MNTEVSLENPDKVKLIPEEKKRKRQLNSPESTQRHKRATQLQSKTKEAEIMAGKGEEDDKLNKIMKMMTDMMSDIKDIKNEQQNYKEEMQLIREENKELKLKVANLERKVDNMEKKEKKNNIIIRGAEINEKDIKGSVQDPINKLLGRNTEIAAAHVAKPRNGEPFMIIKLEKWEDKREMMRNKGKLKGTGVYIDDDLTEEESRIQKKLRDVAREERQRGKQVRVLYKKLIIDGEVWYWNSKMNQLNKEPATQAKNG